MKIKIDDKEIEIDVFFDKIGTGGRPKKVLTEEAIKLIENLSSIFCTDEEIAMCLETTRETLTNETNGELFRQARKKGEATGKQSLRRKQYAVAMNGNSSMLIWLGKQYLGQRDKLNIEDNDVETFEGLAKTLLERKNNSANN